MMYPVKGKKKTNEKTKDALNHLTGDEINSWNCSAWRDGK